jgi:protein O-mannosyl-transferase
MLDKKPVKDLSGPGSERPEAAWAASAHRGAGKITEPLRLYWDRHGHLSLLLVAITLVAYLPAFLGQFVWDDDGYVTGNLLLHSLKGLWQIWFVPGVTPQYYPLTFTSFWVDYHLWQLNPLGYHLTNVLLQALNAILLWTILRQLRVRGAWLAAAVFAVHPVNVETVAWVTERKNLLAGFFYLCSALACLRFWLPDPATADGRVTGDSRTSAIGLGNWKFYWLALCLYLCALLAKTATIALPVAVLLVVWWKRGKIGWRELFPLAPFLAVGMAMGLLTVWVEKHFVQAVGREWVFSFLERCLIAGRAVWFYLGRLVWPHPLMFVYPRWEIHAAQPLAYLPVLALFVVLFILWLNRKGWARPVLVALAYFLALLFPVLGFFNVYFFRYSFVADHFQYLASIGPLTLAAAGMATALGFWGKGNRFLKPALCGALLLTLGLLTWRQCGMYADSETLWRATIARNPNSWPAYNNLGEIFFQAGKIDEAIEQYQKALEINPAHAEAHSNLGVALAEAGRIDEAIVHFQRALELKIQPDAGRVYNNLGLALFRKGQVDEAMVYFQKALEIHPDSVSARDNFGNALLQKGLVDAAIVQYRKALEIQPDNAEYHNKLGYALLRKGLMDEATTHLQKALEIRPDYPSAGYNLAQVAWILATGPEASVQNGAKAIELAEEVQRLSGGEDPMINMTLAAGYAEAGQFPKALETAQRAQKLAADQNQGRLVDAIRGQIKCYQAGIPFRDARLTNAPAQSRLH